MHPYVGKVVYHVAQFINREPVGSLIKELEQTQWYSSEELEELQWRSLKKLLHYAYENIPFYRTKLNDHGIIPDDIRRKEDFKKIPLLTKDDLRESKELLISPNPPEGYMVATTSGSEGNPLTILKSKTSWGYHHAKLFRTYRWYGVDVGDKWARIMGANIVAKKRVEDYIKSTLLNRIKLPTVDMGEDACVSFYRKMLRFKPVYLYGYPTAINHFVNTLRSLGIEGRGLHLKFVVCSGEPLGDLERGNIEDFFSSRVVNDYASSEVGTISIECPEGNMHIPVESLVVETIESEDAISGGQEVVVTDLHNYVMPIIRYRIGDLTGTVEGKCACGRGLPVMGQPNGRLTAMITTPDGKKVHSMVFHYIIRQLLARGCTIEHFKVVQTEPYDFVVYLVADLHQNHRNFLLSKLKEYLGSNANFQINIVSHIDRLPSGKFKMFEKAF